MIGAKAIWVFRWQRNPGRSWSALGLQASNRRYQGTASQWEKVRKELNTARLGQTLTNACDKLRRSRAWRFAMSGRGGWVHNQPSTVAGLGIIYRRERRWKQSPNDTTASLRFGGVTRRSIESRISVNAVSRRWQTS